MRSSFVVKKRKLKAEVQELTWTLVDDQATEGQVRRLTELLQESHEARRVYVSCMQMHSDLYFLLGNRKSLLPQAIQERSPQKTAGVTAGLPAAAADVPLCSGAAS
jgi:hypothetical protein